MVINFKIFKHSVAVAEFNVNYYLTRMQTLKQYRAPIEEQFKKMKDNAAKLNEKLEDIDENKEEEEKELEITEKVEIENKPIQIEEKNNEKMNKNSEKPIEFLKQILCLKDSKIKIIPTFEDIDKILEKKKFQGIFDVVILGFIHSGYIKRKELLNVVKEKGEVWIESARFLVPLKIKERDDLDKKLVEFAKDIKLEEKMYGKPYYKRFSK